MPYNIWVNGAYSAGNSGEVIEVRNPATEEVIDTAPAANAADTLWINDPLTDNDAGPFGGFKMSGMGRELGEEGLDEFCETKHVHWDFVSEVKPWWYPYAKK